MSIFSLFCQDREFRRRLETSRDRLYRMAYAWSHDPDLADDLVQEALAKALKNSDKIRDHAALDAWLFRILSNCWHDHFRRQRDMVEIEENDHVHELTPERLHATQEIVHSVRNAIGELPMGQRQVVTLVDLEGFSYAEVAEILGIPAGTVMSRLCRARRALKERLLDSSLAERTMPPTVRLVK